MIEKIVEGKMSKFYEEDALLDQPFIKEQTVSIKDLIAQKVGKLEREHHHPPLRPFPSRRSELDRRPDEGTDRKRGTGVVCS